MSDNSAAMSLQRLIIELANCNQEKNFLILNVSETFKY